jgi:hypothetical protein
MKLGELIDEARERTGDVNTPPLVSDERWTRFANRAQTEACRRSRLLVDSSTDATCKVTLVANTAVYALHKSVLFVRRATIDGQSRPLVRIHHRDLDMSGTEWMSETGDIDGWVIGLDTGKLRLYRQPTAAGVARLTVVRLPLAAMAALNTDEPEIDERYHIALVDWMVHEFYSTNDSELKDETKAAAALAEFEREFGPAQPALEEAWAQEHYGFQADDGNVYGA